MIRDYRILFTSHGRQVEISPTAPCRLLEDGLSGFGCAGFDVGLCSYASAAGGYAQKRRFAERELSLTFEIAGDRSEEIRRMLISMMDPAEDGELDVRIGDAHRRITVIPWDEARFVTPLFTDYVEVTLSFVAPTVFFRDAEDVAVRFADAVPLLTFPMNFMQNAGLASGIYRTTDTAAVVNPGDAPCGMVVTVRAAGGEVKNPCIRCGEKYILIPTTLSDGDVLTVDTRARRKNITINGERCFQFEKGSTFFTLPTGESSVTVTCGEGKPYLEASLTFTPLYFGM